MADLSTIVNVSLLVSGQAVAEDNVNVVAMITSDTSILNSSNRFLLFSNAKDVASKFGSSNEVTSFANSFFATSPNPINAGGVLVIGYWRSVVENVLATAGYLQSEVLSEVNIINQLQLISDGSMDIDIDNVTFVLDTLDFQTATNLDDVADTINIALIGLTAGATASILNFRLVITSDTTGITSIVDYAVPGVAGTFIGSILALTAGSGAISVIGKIADTLNPETKVEALTELSALVSYKGVMFLDNPTSIEVTEIATYIQAVNILSYDVFFDPLNLEIDVSNVVWSNKISGFTNYRCLYSALGNRKFAISYMARMHTVNFNSANSAITMNLKKLSIPAEDYDTTTTSKAQAVGLDLYTTFKNVPLTLTSGINDFVDNVYNLISFINVLQTTVFNVLGTTPTKIPQTIDGVNQLVDACEQTCEQYVRALVFAPGKWLSSDTFGNINTFNNNIETKGFYVLSELLSNQSLSQRQSRVAPVIRVAVKNAGAIHKADIIINFNQ